MKTFFLSPTQANILPSPCMDHSVSNSAMSIAIQSIQIAFEELGCTVDVILCTQLGDAARLNKQKCLCLLFLGNIHKVCIWFLSFFYNHLYVFICQHLPSLSAVNSQIITTSIQQMILALDNTMVTSSDPPDSAPIPFSTCIFLGEPGCPSIDITSKDLARLTTGRTTHQEIAQIYACST